MMRPLLQVEVGGVVRAPGTYPLESEMRISDLIRAGGSLVCKKPMRSKRS